MPPLSGLPSFITEPKSWDVDALDYGSLLLSTDTLNVEMAGVSTAARQDTGNTTLASSLTELQSILAKLNASLAVTGTFYQATQPVSGTVTANAGTNLNTSALALDTTLSAIKTQTDKLAFTGSLLQTSASLIGGGDGAILDGVNPLLKATVTAALALKMDGSAVTQPVSAASLPLPTNAATSALQTTGNTSLATLAADPPTASNQNTGNITLGNLYGELQQKTEPADQQHVIVDTMPPVTAATSADVLDADADAGYTDGATGQNLTQTPDGRLRVLTAGVVSDAPLSGIDVGSNVAFSMTTDGRLRVSSAEARVHFDMFSSDSPFFDMPALTSPDNLWDVGPSSPRGGLL